MPTLFPPPPMSSIIPGNLTAPNSTIAPHNDTLKVICAWPVSGQYGPGSRVLFYVLIAACVFARKSEWLRNAALAAALLFPAVAALHGIVLAAVHVEGAVDMDIYGAFQLCSIGILAAPVAVRLSTTYFYKISGRNIIFLWTGLVLAGLLSLTIEFFRLSSTQCKHDDNGNPVSPSAANFSYDTMCGLICDTERGPFSPIRGGSANNIYVIPEPSKLTFSTATLLSAACCIPAILSLLSMWNRILQINWRVRFGGRFGQEVDEDEDKATIGEMRRADGFIRKWLRAVEIPLFFGAVLAILVIGERNFFSKQVFYQTEPMASIGQWAPVVGTGLAAIGSLYLLLSADIDDVKDETDSNASTQQGNCSMQHVNTGLFTASLHSVATPTVNDIHHSPSHDSNRTSYDTPVFPTISRPTPSHQPRRSDTGNRRMVAQRLTAVADYLGTPALDRFDDSDFKHGKAVDFPEIPGEEHRNRALRQIRTQYNQPHDEDDNNMTPLAREHSRAPSINGSFVSGLGIEGVSMAPRSSSPHSIRSPLPPSPMTTKGARSNTLSSGQRGSFEGQMLPSSPTTAGRPRQRRDTLEVPGRTHSSPTSIDTPTRTQLSPIIVVSPEHVAENLTESPVVHEADRSLTPSAP